MSRPVDDATVDLIGPMEPPRLPRFRVAYRGCLVPGVEVQEDGPDRYEIRLDGRLVYEGFAREELTRALRVIADAQAIAAGYPCHGAKKRRSPYAVRVHQIGGPDPGLRLVETDPDSDGAP